MESIFQQDPPPILYQYRRPTNRAIDRLRRHILYFGSPADFNDQREWCVPPRIPENATWQDMRKFLKKRKSQELTVTYARIKSQSPSRKHAIRGLNKAFAQILERWRCKEGGVSCFTTSQYNMLMWAEYAKHGEGFCLAFDSGMRLESGEVLMPVVYSETPPNDNALKIQESTEELFPKLLTQKSMFWKDEKEWRLMRKGITNDEERESRYTPESLKAVFLGAKMEPSKRDEIRGILEKEKYPAITQLWQGFLNDAGDEVSFHPVNEAAQAEDARRKHK